MYTFQDFTRDLVGGTSGAVARAISQHKGQEAFRTALTADEYDHQRNTTIRSFVKWLYRRDGTQVVDSTSANNRICSNFFNALNTQRAQYSLGNGVTFETDGVKDKLGKTFDTRLQAAGYYALIHGVSFLFWNVDHVHVFQYTEFAPLIDEETGALRAGVRYWQVDQDKPTIAVLYEEDGYTKLRGDSKCSGFEIIEQKRAYRQTLSQAPADAEPEIIGEENYGSLPIIPLYGSRLKQSTLIGLQAQIDAYDLVMSGFANNLQDCAEIYWLVNGGGGMNDDDLMRFRDRLKMHKIANVKNADETNVSAYTQEIPTAASEAFLQAIRAEIYESFGALDVHTVSAGATNDHVAAAYQPMDERADDFEYQLIEAVQALLELLGIEDTPIFKRNQISNMKEQTEMVVSAAQYLDEETILKKLPFLSNDEIDEILKRKQEEDAQRMEDLEMMAEEQEDDQEDSEDDQPAKKKGMSDDE